VDRAGLHSKCAVLVFVMGCLQVSDLTRANLACQLNLNFKSLDSLSLHLLETCLHFPVADC
jgi:hypothetical protein